MTENWLYPDGRFRTRAHLGEPLTADGRGVPQGGRLDRGTTFLDEENEPAGSRDAQFFVDMPRTVDGVRDALLDDIECLDRRRGQERSWCLTDQMREPVPDVRHTPRRHGQHLAHARRRRRHPIARHGQGPHRTRRRRAVLHLGRGPRGPRRSSSPTPRPDRSSVPNASSSSLHRAPRSNPPPSRSSLPSSLPSPSRNDGVGNHSIARHVISGDLLRHIHKGHRPELPYAGPKWRSDVHPPSRSNQRQLSTTS